MCVCVRARVTAAAPSMSAVKKLFVAYNGSEFEVIVTPGMIVNRAIARASHNFGVRGEVRACSGCAPGAFWAR